MTTTTDFVAVHRERLTQGSSLPARLLWRACGSRLPKAVEICAGKDLTFLCRPMLRLSGSASHVSVNLTVSIMGQDNICCLKALALHLDRLSDYFLSSRRLRASDIQPVFEIASASYVDVMVVTARVDVKACADELAVALEALLLKIGAVVCLAGTRLGSLMGETSAVLVKAADAGGGGGGPSVFTVTPGRTRLVISRQVCRERLESLRDDGGSSGGGGRTGGLSRQKETLGRILDRRRSHRSFRGVLLSGPPGCGKTSLLAEVAVERSFLVKSIHSSELLRSEEGETAKEISRVFRECGLHAKEGRTMLVLDDIGMLYVLVYIHVHTHMLGPEVGLKHLPRM